MRTAIQPTVRNEVGPARSDAPTSGRETSGTFVLEELLRRHAAEIQAFLHRLAGDFQVAEELCQDTFMKAHRGLEGLREAGAARRWLFAIALNCFNDRVRRRGHREERRQESLGDRDAAASRDGEPPVQATTGEFSDLLRRAMSELPPRQRSVLVLHGVEGFSHAQIAEVLDISADSVKVNLFHARRRMRGIIEEALAGEERKER